MRTCSSDQLGNGKLTRSLARDCTLEMILPTTTQDSSSLLDYDREVQEK